ncbi:MAG: hypothetical protein VX071_01330, partial [Candidatus Thermoplasmatota archaeon]|nr:hypothetical protein [Candidatus Thermoplasmatota archaeon]
MALRIVTSNTVSETDFSILHVLPWSSNGPKTFKGLPPSNTAGVLMVTKLCLLVPLASGEEVRQILIDQECLDRAFTPRSIGNELALPVHEGFLPDAIDFEHRLEQVDVEPAPPAIDPHSRLYTAIA